MYLLLLWSTFVTAFGHSCVKYRTFSSKVVTLVSTTVDGLCLLTVKIVIWEHWESNVSQLYLNAESNSQCCVIALAPQNKETGQSGFNLVRKPVWSLLTPLQCVRVHTFSHRHLWGKNGLGSNKVATCWITRLRGRFILWKRDNEQELKVKLDIRLPTSSKTVYLN